jgi:hypothetical protein
MQVIKSVRRVEITFWTVVIPLMKNQRFVRGAIVASILGIILSLLGIASLVFDHDPVNSPQNRAVLVSQPQAVTAVPTQEQRNVLVILVDSLSTSEARLEGLWLVGKLASNPRLVFFPIFPASKDGDPEGWSGKFSLDGDGRPSTTFVQNLQAKNIYWDNYVVVDHTSLAELIELSGRIAWDGKQLSGPDVVAKMPLARLEPKAALQTQAFIAQELCHNTAALMHSADPALLWGLLTHRMRSDLELTSVQSASNDFTLIVGGPSCEFPTFQEITLLNGTN